MWMGACAGSGALGVRWERRVTARRRAAVIRGWRMF